MQALLTTERIPFPQLHAFLFHVVTAMFILGKQLASELGRHWNLRYQTFKKYDFNHCIINSSD